MKPISSSDTDCFKNFEYHNILKKRYRDDDDEEEEEDEKEMQRYCNPSFRLEVNRHNDAATFDCRCDAPKQNDNVNKDAGDVLRVRKTNTTHVLRYNQLPKGT